MMATRKTEVKAPKKKAKAPKKKAPKGLPNRVDGRTEQKRLEQGAAERRPKVHRMSLKGFDTRRIGKQFGVSHTTIAKDLKKFRDQLNAESLELAGDRKDQEDARRALEDEKLDEQQILIHGVLNPDPKASGARIRLASDLAAIVREAGEGPEKTRLKGPEKTRLLKEIAGLATEGRRPTNKQVLACAEALGKVGDRRCRLWGLNGPVKLEKVQPRGNFRERVLGALGELDAAETLLALALGEDPEIADG
jgi:hypothetical protein